MDAIPVAPIVLGHNSFFGVNHLSKEEGAQREAKFEATSAILEIVHFALERDVDAMMMSTHPRANLVAAAVKEERGLADRLRFYPLLPYIAKYVRQSNERGIVNVVLDQLKGIGLGQRLQIVSRGGLGVIRKDVDDLLRTLIQIELSPFQGLRLGAVFLHDVLTDLALALDLPTIFTLYAEEIQTRFQTRPALATKNLPLLVQRFRQWGLELPLILAHVNKTGFCVNPSLEAVEQCLRENAVEVMAMGTLASGYLAPQEAYEYLFSLPNICSVTVGVSSRAHAEETFAAIRHCRREQTDESPTGLRAAAAA